MAAAVRPRQAGTEHQADRPQHGPDQGDGHRRGLPSVSSGAARSPSDNRPSTTSPARKAVGIALNSLTLRRAGRSDRMFSRLRHLRSGRHGSICDQGREAARLTRECFPGCREWPDGAHCFHDPPAHSYALRGLAATLGVLPGIAVSIAVVRLCGGLVRADALDAFAGQQRGDRVSFGLCGRSWPGIGRAIRSAGCLPPRSR